MTPEEITEHFEVQANTRIAFVNKIAGESLDQIAKAQETLFTHLTDIIEMDTVELCLFRELEVHARNNTLTTEIVVRILKDLEDFRVHVKAKQEAMLKTLGTETIYDA